MANCTKRGGWSWSNQDSISAIAGRYSPLPTNAIRPGSCMWRPYAHTTRRARFTHPLSHVACGLRLVICDLGLPGVV